MNRNGELRILAQLSKSMAVMCLRNLEVFEGIHRGTWPVSRTGDYSDVVVIDADGRRIPWPEVAHFDDDTMRELMRQVVNKIYTFQAKMADPVFLDIADRCLREAQLWDEPEMDEDFLAAIESRRAREGGGE